MMKKTFIPNWYIDQKNEIQNKKIKICIVVTIVLNIFLMSLIFNTSDKLKDINDVRAVNPKNEIKEKVEVLKKSSITIEKYKEISDFSKQNNLNFTNIIITEFETEIEIRAKSYEEYVMIVRCLEDNYIIKKLVPNTKNEGEYNFKVMLEV
ncbi:MAG: hypothetical protein ACREVX_03690 [Clostridium sp.]|uniref:hypothetical protein n=1 Tax=Clostridium sp. TaxID=1506 RepID=UPI003D6CBE08